jgi:hypothetical protein
VEKKTHNSQRTDILTQYSVAIITLLAIGYVLIITNPPKELLHIGNDNVIATRHLSMPDMYTYRGSIILFLILLGLLSLFIGLQSSIIFEIEKKSLKNVYFVGSGLLVFLFCSLLNPYYGEYLSDVALLIGYTAWATAAFLTFPSRRQSTTLFVGVNLTASICLITCATVALFVFNHLSEKVGNFVFSFAAFLTAVSVGWLIADLT